MSWLSCSAHARLGRILCALMLAALLAAPTAASATEPNKILTNKNPQALPIGLTFHPDVPYTFRKAIVDDLYWLSTRGPIQDERLRHLLQIEAPMTGASLVAWFLDRIHVVGLFGWCPQTDFISIYFNHAGFTVHRSIRKCAPPPSAFLAFVPGRPFSQLKVMDIAQGIAIDRDVRIVPETWPDRFMWPVMVISSSFLKEGASIPARVRRLSGLLHEASHVEGLRHGVCKLDDWKLADYALGPFTFPSHFRLGDRYCDDPNDGSAGTVEASFLRAMAEACDCSPKEKETIKFYEWAAWLYQGVPLKEPVVAPLDGDFQSIKGLGGKSLKTFPPAEFMEAGLQYTEMFLRACQNGCSAKEQVSGWRDQLLALRAFGNDLKEREVFVGSWESSTSKRPPVKRPLDVDGARKWLAAAAKAAKNGYNVETTSLVSCADLQDKC